jgi:FkbM family methyltransferase
MIFPQKFKKTTVWNKISYSDLYQKARFPKRFKGNKLEYEFYKSLLTNKNELIFDVGANTGEKAAIFKRLSKKIICFEPSPNSIDTLKKRFAWTNVSIVPIALSDMESTTQLYILENMETLNSVSNKQLKHVVQPMSKGEKINVMDVKTETLDNAIKKFGTPDYIKIDVEGHEKEVIAGLTRPVKYLSFENCSSLFLKEGIASIEHLEEIANGKGMFNICVNRQFIFKEFSASNLIIDHLKNNRYDAAEIYCLSFNA